MRLDTAIHECHSTWVAKLETELHRGSEAFQYRVAQVVVDASEVRQQAHGADILAENPRGELSSVIGMHDPANALFDSVCRSLPPPWSVLVGRAGFM
ncbi:hypothetical protein H0264_11015 [Nocardia huaxiensis]|uniref:Uncharacterized protein n=1 Tax=Nocardia huaxiensis TaxID=2755382 RepID=A0A7D6Z6D6_9NOCA|nr:hypothetical protein H0264_11015 [Nocardia huaxiensis]